MRPAALRALGLTLSGSLLSGCQIFCVYDCYATAPPPTRTSVTVIPATADGHVGTVVVDPDATRGVLNTAYASMRIEDGKAPVAYTSTPEEVRAKFADVIAAQPRAPVSFTVYFDTGNDRISARSMGVLDQLRAEMAKRGNSEITVIGHTDRMGTDENNDALSERRARRVRQQLIEFGIPADLIAVAARGEREPVVATADGAAEPRNRRVEINIR